MLGGGHIMLFRCYIIGVVVKGLVVCIEVMVEFVAKVVVVFGVFGGCDVMVVCIRVVSVVEGDVGGRI